MAKKEPGEGQVKARVLAAGGYGNVNDVIIVAGDEAKFALAAGWLDTSPEAVAYAESLVAADPAIE